MITRYLPFVSYAPVHFVSAQSGANVETMFDDALAISHNVHERVSTGVLNDTIRRAIADHAVPSVRASRSRFATRRRRNLAADHHHLLLSS